MNTTELPQHIADWLAVNNDVPDDRLRCPVCGEWFTGIDPLAPYHWETCWCEKCHSFPMTPKE